MSSKRKCDCTVGVKCSRCSCPLYTRDNTNLEDCKRHGETRRGRDNNCCWEYTCNNGMCKCSCKLSASEASVKLTTDDTGDCDCELAHCKRCDHAVFIIAEGCAVCTEHAKSKTIHQGVYAEGGIVCSAAFGHDVQCECKAPKPEPAPDQCECTPSVCVDCGCKLYITEVNQKTRCDEHGNTRRGIECDRCRERRCRNNMCVCKCTRGDCDVKLTEKDTGACECALSRCVTCHHWLYIVELGHDACGEHSDSKTLRQGAECSVCSESTCLACKCACEDEPEPKPKKEKRPRSFEVPLKKKGEGKPERKQIPKKNDKETEPAVAVNNNKCTVCHELECYDCREDIYVPGYDMGECDDDHGTRKEGEYADCCGIARCNNGECGCKCVVCACEEFTCAHCDIYYVVPPWNFAECNVMHAATRMRDCRKVHNCKECNSIVCGVCKGPCSGDQQVGPPPIGQEDTDPHHLALVQRCLDAKAKAAAAAAAKDSHRLVEVSKGHWRVEKQKAAADAEKVIAPDSSSDTESDDDVKAKLAVVKTKTTAAAAAAAMMPPPAPRKRMTAEELAALSARIEARKRKIADMQKKSAQETAERMATAKKAKLASKAATS